MTTQQKPGKGRDPSKASPFARLLRNKSGAFAMQFALMVVPLVACTGLAIDGGRSFLARYELESALDAAALAVGSTTGDTTALNALARKYVDSNFKAPDTTQVVLTLTPTSDIVTLHGTTDLTTYFMPLMGIPRVTISADSEVRRGGGNVEVGLTLDVTGSMGSTGDPNSRISTLIRAANDLIDTVVNDVQTPWFSKIAIVPWAANVNVGSYAAALRGPTRSTAITGAGWRNGPAQTITSVSWKNGTTKTISAAAWKNGASKTASKIQEASSKTTVTSNSHGFANGDFIYLTNANGGFTSLNNTIFLVAGVATNTFRLQTTAGVEINLSGTPTNATTATLQKCYNSTCQVLATTSAAHGYSVGDTVYISSSTGMTEINNTPSAPIVIAALGVTSPTTTFFVPGTGPTITSTYVASSGRVQKCFTATCELKVTTAANHNFANSDRIYITGVNGATGTTPAVNNTPGATWSIAGVTANTFILPATQGPAYTLDYISGGTATECITATCEIEIYSPAHGISTNDKVYITGLGGMTGSTPSINTYNAWTATNISANTFTLSGSIGPNYTDYTSGGTVWCLLQGCEYYRYQTASGSYPVAQISNCVTERVGTEANTDAAPAAGAYLGDDYPVATACSAGNMIVPLTANKTTLHSTINSLSVGGSTAGQIGVGWGWYMLSPNFASLWPSTENRPLAYNTAHLNKVMVLMTDGDFNTGHCNGVISNDYANGANSSTRIFCNATNGSPYTNAQAICTNMKAASVTIFTVGFEVSAGSAPDNFLRACATDTSHYYLASNNAELEAAFAQIATNISRLRISR